MSSTSVESTQRSLNHRWTHTLRHNNTRVCAHICTLTLSPFVCFGREGSVSLSSASTCSLLSWKKLNKYHANMANHSSHALWHPFLVLSFSDTCIHAYSKYIFPFMQSANKITCWWKRATCCVLKSRMPNMASLLCSVARQPITLENPRCFVFWWLLW